MNFLNRISLAAVVLVASTLAATASQGPGTSPGTATLLEQALLVTGIIFASCAGLAFRFLRR